MFFGTSIYTFSARGLGRCILFFVGILCLCKPQVQAQTAREGQKALPFRINGEFPAAKIAIPETGFAPPESFLKHPEYGKLPYNAPCENCFEQIEKRTETTRYFVERGSDGTKFFEQTSFGPLHVKDEQGFWVSITASLKPEARHRFTSSAQLFPFEADLQQGVCRMQNGDAVFSWNKNLSLSKKRPDGSMVQFGAANLSNYTAGADGIHIKDAWPGIDIQIISLMGSVHTDFILKNDPGPGELIIRDHFEYSSGLMLSSPSGRFSSGFDITQTDGTPLYHYDQAFVRDSDPKGHGLLYLDYETGPFHSDLFFNRDAALAQGLQFPMVIDPLVTASNTLPQGAIGGSGYNAVCFTGGCNYTLTVNAPANATITDIITNFDYIAQGACWLNEGATTYSYNGCQSPNTPGFFWYCNNFGGGTCLGTNISLWSDFQSCVPLPQCAPYPMNFTMTLYRCFQAGGGCSNSCIGAGSPWTMTIQGQTVSMAFATASNANICQGASTNLQATGTWGVPPYSVSWNPGGLTGSPVSVSPAATTVYTATVTDACGQTATQNVVVNVTPSANPGFTINPNPVCANQPVTLSGLGFGPASSYDWLTPGASTGATNNLQTVAGITYPVAGNYTITLNYTQGACVFPLSNPITVSAGPPPPAFSTNSPVCTGSQLSFDGPSIPGAVYQWSGPNGFVSALEDPFINNVSPPASGVYTLIVTLNGCASQPATQNVLITPPPPLPVIGSNSPVCEGSALNLTSPSIPGAVYSWTGPNGFTSAVEDPTIPGVLSTMSGVYSLVVSISGCSSPQADINVTVQAAPVATALNNGPFCPGSTIQLSASGGTSYSWSGPAGFAGNLQNPVINNCNVANSGVYTVVITDATGCTATATTTVTVSNVLTFTIGSNSPVCAGADVIFNAPAPVGAVYSWSGPGGFVSAIQNPVINLATAANAGTYTLNLTDANGCSGTATTQVTVNPPPIANANNTGPYCTGDLVQLNAGGGISYSWTGPNGFVSLVQNPSPGAASAAIAGTYTVVVTDAGNCSASANTTIIINTVPNSNASNSGPYCAGDAISLNGSGGVSYSWSGPLGYSSNQQSPVINASSASMSGVYTVVVTDAGGCTGTATTNVLVNALPNAIASNTGPYCDGDAITLSVSNGINFSWTGPGGFASALQNPVIGSAGTAASGVYSVEVTDGNGCSNAFTTAVTVNGLPVITAGNGGSYCPGNNMQLNASGGTTYSWTGPLGFNSPLQNPFLNNATLAMNGVYTVTGIDANGCSAQATTNLVVAANLAVVAGFSGVVCEGQNVTLTSTAIPSASYVWSGPGAFFSNVQDPVINGITSAQSGQYDVLVTNVNGCTGTSSVQVNVNPSPQAQASSTAPICEFSALQLNAAGGTTYVWSGPGAFSSNQQNPQIGSAALASAGVYQVTVTDANGCAATATTNVVINAAPILALTQNGPVCEGGTLQLNAGTGGVNYVWNGPSGFSSNSVSPVITGIAPGGAGTYTVIATNASGCTATASTQVLINPLPVPVFSADRREGCSPVCVQFSSLQSSSSATLVGYEWRVDGVSFSTASDPVYCFVPVGQYELSLTLTDANGCEATASAVDFISVADWPEASFTVPSDVIPLSDPTLQVTNTSQGAVLYVWDFGDGSESNEENPLHQYPQEGEYCVTLTVQSALACSSNFTRCIRVESDFVVFIPNSFSPNGDTFNDVFHVKGTGISKLTMQIFNRWGEAIYSEEGEECFWDGNAGGVPSPQGVYLYSLRVRSESGKVTEYYGDLTLLK